MKILGIETSCDETAAAVLEVSRGKTKVLSSVISSQIKIHKKYGGVVPEVAARKHAEVIFDVVAKALKQKNKKARKQKDKSLPASLFKREGLEEIDLIAVTEGPGLVTSLRVGVLAAQTIASLAKKPLVGVNHIEAHLLSALLSCHCERSNGARQSHCFRHRPREGGDCFVGVPPRNDIFPALGLIVSGGHTELVLVKKIGDYKIIGTTRDDAVGEAFDKVAKMLELGYPGGPAIAHEAEKNIHNSPQPPLTLRGGEEIKLPRPMINSNDFDFSFSGLKTAVLYLTKKMTPAELKKNTPAIAAEFQKAAIEVLVAKTKKAAEKYNVKSILVGGGVIANKELREALQKLDFPVYLPEMQFTGDNAAMIAFAGYHQYQRSKEAKKQKSIYNIMAKPNLGI